MAQNDAHARHGELLAALVAAGYVKERAAQKLLDPANRAQALTMPTDSARAALDWLVTHRYARAEDERLATNRLAERLWYGDAPDANLKRVLRRLTGLDARLDSRIMAHRRASLVRRGKGVLLGLSAIAATVAGGVLVYSGRLAGPPAPACDARSTNEALVRTAMQMSYPGMADDPLRENPVSAGDYTVSFSNETQVGYDRENGSRGCTAFINIAGQNTRSKIGYEIMRVQNSRDPAVQILPHDFVMARYSATGLNKKLGAPVGREAMRKVMIDALGGSAENENTNGNTYCPACTQNGYATGSDSNGDSNGDSTQTLFSDRPMRSASRIMQVHPLADCRKLNARQYACPVQVEYRSSLPYTGIGLPSPGADPILLKGEFVFERMDNVSGNGLGNGWRMADGFGNAFAKAIEESTQAGGGKGKSGDDAGR